MPRAPLVAVVALLAVTAALVAVIVRPAGPLATPSASPAPGQIATASPTAAAAAPSATPSPTAAPTASPRDLYTSKALGFALSLPSPWRRAACGGSDPGARDLPLSEQLTSAPVMEEHVGHAGRANDRIDVRAEDPRGLTPKQFAAGLAVTVDGVVNEDARASWYSHYVWSKWNAFPPGGGATPMSPGPATWNVQLAMRQTPTGWYWTGTLLVHSF